MDKAYKLKGTEIRPIAVGRGDCFASDMVTVEGKPVRFMYRETPDSETDSGWRFMSGLESDEYANDASNLGIFDVNTIANYDSTVVPYLDAPVGSAFEKPSISGGFVRVTDWARGDAGEV